MALTLFSTLFDAIWPRTTYGAERRKPATRTADKRATFIGEAIVSEWANDDGGIVLFKAKYRTLNGPVFANNKFQQKGRFQNRIFLLFLSIMRRPKSLRMY